MMRVKVTDSVYPFILLSLLCYISVTGYFFVSGQYLDAPVQALFASFLHAVMLHILVWQFAKIICADKRRILSPVSVFLVVILFRFGISYLKYFSEPNYPEYTADMTLRLLGTFLVFVSMLGLLRWWTWWSSRHPDKVQLILHNMGKIRSFEVFVFLGSLIPVIGFFLNIIAFIFGEMSLAGTVVLSRSEFIFLSIASSLFFPMFISLSFLKKGGIRKITESIAIISALLVMIMMKSRSSFMILMLLIPLFNLHSLKKQSQVMSRAVLFFLALPLLALTVAVPLSDYVKGGIDPNFKNLVWTTNRAELSDYAVSICLADSQFRPYIILKNAVLWALPGSIINKAYLEYADVDFQYAQGWRLSDYREGYTLETVDYTDTIFSAGAFLVGYIGMILFPIFWVGAFIWFIDKCSGMLSAAAYLACFSPIINVEIGIWSIIAIWRNYILVTVIIYFAMKIVLFFTIKRKGREHSMEKLLACTE